MFIKYNQNLKTKARELRNNPTATEKIFWDFLRKEFSKFHFMKQKPLEHFILDFYCSQLKLIIEIDGGVHDFQKEKDKERDNYFLMKHGIRTLRFTNDGVNNNISRIKMEIEQNIKA